MSANCVRWDRVQAALDACTKLNELSYANFIRTYAATVYVAKQPVDDASAS